MEMEKRNLLINTVLSSIIFILGVAFLITLKWKVFGLLFIFIAIAFSFITVIRISKGQLHTNNLSSNGERNVHHHHYYKNETSHEDVDEFDTNNEK